MATPHGFKWSKKGSANLEEMTSVSGEEVTYSKNPKKTFDVMARGPEVALTPGQEMTVAGVTGVAETCQCDFLPDTLENGEVGEVWETTATLKVTSLAVGSRS